MANKNEKKVKVYKSKKKRVPESKIIQELQAKYDSVSITCYDLCIIQRTIYLHNYRKTLFILD